LRERERERESMVFNATFNNISVIIIMAVSFIGGGNWSTQRIPLENSLNLKTNYDTKYIGSD
jgi:hypothetical protein